MADTIIIIELGIIFGLICIALWLLGMLSKATTLLTRYTALTAKLLTELSAKKEADMKISIGGVDVPINTSNTATVVSNNELNLKKNGKKIKK